MAKYAIITDGIVSNTAVSETKINAAWVLCDGNADIGWQYDGTNFSAPNIIITEKEIREERNKKLTETDFYGLSDVTITSEMTAYRQALRDIPQQAGFPNSVTWPTKPE